MQRWATARMPLPRTGLHLDVACGYGTFLAELDWRFPGLRLVGLNIDFNGPHRMEAGVKEQMARQGYYVPFGQVRMVTARRNG